MPLLYRPLRDVVSNGDHLLADGVSPSCGESLSINMLLGERPSMTHIDAFADQD